jgi:hypothetical protein
MAGGIIDDLAALPSVRSKAASVPPIDPIPVTPARAAAGFIDELEALPPVGQPDVVPEDVLDTPYSEELLSGYGKYGLAEMPPERRPDDVFFEEIPGLIVSGHPAYFDQGPSSVQTLHALPHPDDIPEDPPEAILEGAQLGTLKGAATKWDITAPAAWLMEQVPPALREKVFAEPEELEELNREQISVLWRRMRSKYRRTSRKDPMKRAQILGEFITRWNPRLASQLGYTKEGYHKPEGMWHILDTFDAYTRRPLASLTNTLMDLRRWEIARVADPGKYKKPGMRDALSMLQQNYTGDKASLRDFATQLTNTALYFSTMGGAPEGVSDQAYAQSLLESMDLGAEEVEHEIAEKLTTFGYEMYEHPILTGMTAGATAGGVLTKTPHGAGIGAVIGLLGSSAIEINKWWGGVTDEDIERAKQEAIEQGSVGGHFAYALGGAMALDPINALGMATKIPRPPPPGGAAARIMGTGLDLSPRGVEVATRHTKRITDQARLEITAQQATIHGTDAVAPLADVNRHIGRLDDGVARHRARIDDLTMGDKPRPSRLSGETVPEEIERLGSQINKLEDLRNSLLGRFDEANEALLRLDPKATEGVARFPRLISTLKNYLFTQRNSRKLIQEQAKLIAVNDFLQATNKAFKGEARLLGDFAVEELSRLTKIPIEDINKMLPDGVNPLPATYFEDEWVKGLKFADEKGHVLVRVDLDSYGKVTHVTKSPEVARVYRWALDGELGEAARVAAMRPAEGILEALLKKGVKGQPKWKRLLKRSREQLKALHEPNTSIIPGVRRSLTGRAVEWATSKAYLGARGGKSLRALDELLPPVPKGLTDEAIKSRAALRGESLVNNINPLYYSLGYAMARAVPWLDPVRRAIGGVMFTPKVGFGAKPQIYTQSIGPRAGWLGRYLPDERAVLPKEQIMQPAIWKASTDNFRQQARVASHLRERMPKLKLQILKISDEPAELEFLTHFAEMGWDSVKESDQVFKEYLASVALRKIEKTVDAITLPYRAATEEGGKVKPGKSFRLEQADSERVLEAIGTLRTLSDEGAVPVIEGALLDDLAKQVSGHFEQTGKLSSFEAERAAIKAGSPAAVTRMRNLELLKKRLAVFTAGYDAKVGGKINVNTELSVARMADQYQPELQRIQNGLVGVEERLALKTGDPEPSVPISDFVSDTLREAEEFLPSFPGRTFDERLFRPDEAAALGTPEKLRTTPARVSTENVVTSQKVLDRVIVQTRGQPNVRALNEKIKGAGKYYEQTSVPVASVKASSDDMRGIDFRGADESKGPIVVDRDGLIIDGRHRYALALQRGDESIAVYRPIDAPKTSVDQWRIRRDESALSPEMHLAEVQTAVKNGEKVPVDVLLDYPVEVIGRVRADLKKDLRKVKEAQSKLRVASDELVDLKQRLMGDGVDLLKSPQFRQAQRNIRSAKADLAKVRSASFLATLRRAISRVEKSAADKDLVLPIGSKQRHMLEATRQLYKNRMLDIQTVIEGEATAIRARGNARRAAATRSIIPRVEMSPPQRSRLNRAIDDLNTNLRGPESEIDSLPIQEVNRLLDEISDPALSSRVAEMRLAIAREPSLMKKRSMRRKLESGLKKALSSREARATELIGATPLEQAVSVARTRSALKDLPGPAVTKRALTSKLDDIDAELTQLSKTLDDLDYDLRTPEQQRKSLTQTIDSSVNVLNAAAAKFLNEVTILKNSEVARSLANMSTEQQARVARMVKNPDLYRLKAGKKNLVTDLKSQRAKLIASIGRLEAKGKDTKKAKKSVAKIDEQIGILGDDASVARIVEAAKLMRGFFDKWFEELKAAGLFREVDRDAFLSRVEVGAYVKHMTDTYSIAKGAAFQGTPVPRWVTRSLGGSDQYFKHERKMSGLIREINKAKRIELAEGFIKEQAGKGRFGAEAQAAAERSSKSARTMRSFLEKRGVNYDNMIDDVMAENGFNEIYNFFESDPFVIMTRYNDMASKEVAFGAFIEDTLDLFPMGREFRNPVDADAAGFERLDRVSALEGILRKKLPQKLRDYEQTIRQMMIDGAPVDEIREFLKKEGVVVDDDVITALKGRDNYIPKQIAEYVRWHNDPVSQSGGKALFLDTWDGLHSWMKAQATIIAFAHIGRNFISNVISTSQELGLAAMNPVTQVQAAMIWGSFRKGDKAFGLGVPVKIGDEVLTRGEWRQRFRDRGFFEAPLSTDFMNESMGVAALDEIPTAKDLFIRSATSTAGAIAGGAISSALGVGPAPGAFAGTAIGVRAGKQWSGAKAVKGQSVWEKFIGMSMKEAQTNVPKTIAAAGTRLSGATIGAMVGSVGGIPGSAIGAAIGGVTMPDYLQMMGMFNTSIEAQARLALGVAAMKKGDDMTAALDSVNAALRDYSDLTPLEKSVLRRVFFFYTWEAGNFKFQLNWLRKNPRAANSIASFTNGIYKQQFTEREFSSMPDPWKYRVVARLHDSRLIGLSGLPWEPMIELLSKKTKMLPAPLAGLATRLNPVPLTIIEGMAGTSFYYDRPWDELTNVRQLTDTPPLYQWLMGVPQEHEVVEKPIWKKGRKTSKTRGVYKSKNPTMLYLAQRFPGNRAMRIYSMISTDTFNSYAMDAGDPTAKATRFQKALNFALGWRFSTIDFDSMQNYAAIQLDEEMKIGINKINDVAVPKKLYLAPKWTERRNRPEDEKLRQLQKGFNE